MVRCLEEMKVRKPEPEFYFECVGKGWREILVALVADLRAMGWDEDVQQVKEKFGGLRFYIGDGSDAVHERIARAEIESLETCEDCGRPGKTRGGGWIRTLCNSCSKAARK